MSLSHPESTVNEMIDLVVDKVDLGTTNSTGKIQLKTALDVLIGEMDASNPAFAAAASRQSIMDTVTASTAIAAGTVSKFVVVDRDGNEAFKGTLTTAGGGGDLEADGLNLSFGIGDPISVTSFTYRGIA